VLAGTRAFDDAEQALLDTAPIRHVPVERIAEVVDAVAASGADAVYVHVDLDVLDPGELACVDFPEPFGVTTADLAAAIRGLTERFPLVGAGITEFAPPGVEEAREDLPTILRILSAITASTRAPRVIPAPSGTEDGAA
jgi:arginase